MAPAAFGVVLLAVGIILALGLAGPLTREGGSVDPSPVPPVPVAPPAPILTPQQQLSQWSVGGGLNRTQAITQDLSSVADAGQQLDTSGMNTACRALQRDIESAQAYAPIPDAQAQASWSSALAHGARSATYCIAGTDAISAPLIQSATSEMNQMTDDLNRTTDRIGVINGTN